ncbi:MAG: hypothetical protein RSD49_20635 [Hafnia sp.]
MKKYILALFLSILSLPAMAVSCEIQGVNELSDTMIQELKVRCEQLKLENKQAEPLAAAAEAAAKSAITREDVSQWAQISTEFAKALGIAAREVGIGVNEFLVTPAGFLTAVVLIWVVVGKSVIGILVGALITLLIVKLNKRFWFSCIEKVEVKGWGGRVKYKDVTRYLTWNEMNDNALGWSIGTMILLAGFWVIVIMSSF